VTATIIRITYNKALCIFREDSVILRALNVTNNLFVVFRNQSIEYAIDIRCDSVLLLIHFTFKEIDHF